MANLLPAKNMVQPRTLTLRKKDILKIDRETAITTIKPKLIAGLVALIEREEDRAQFLTFCRRVDSTVRAWYMRQFDELMQLHALLDPVSGPARLKQQQLTPAQVDKLEQKFLKSLFEMMEKSNFKMMTTEEVELANSGTYLLNLPIAVDKNKLDRRLLSRYFASNPTEEVPKFSDMYVIFRRGIGIDRTSGFFIMEKIDALVARFWNDLLCLLRLRKPQDLTSEVISVKSIKSSRSSQFDADGGNDSVGSHSRSSSSGELEGGQGQRQRLAVSAAPPASGPETSPLLRVDDHLSNGMSSVSLQHRKESKVGFNFNLRQAADADGEIQPDDVLVPSFGIPASGGASLEGQYDGASSSGQQLDGAGAYVHRDESTGDAHLYVERIRIENMQINFRNLFSPVTLQEPTFERVIVVYRKATPKEDGSLLGDRGIHIKHFCNIPLADMEIVLPEKCNPGLTPSDTLKFIGTALFGLVALISSATSGGTIEGSIALAVLLALGAYGAKVYSSFQAAQAEYQNLITRSLYDKQLDSGRATLLLLCDEVIQQEVKEVVLAFFVLMTQGKATLEELDARCEQILEELFHERTDFDAVDALDKLEKLGIVTQDSLGRYGHMSLKHANDLIGVTTDELVLLKGMRGAGLKASKSVRF